MAPRPAALSHADVVRLQGDVSADGRAEVAARLGGQYDRLPDGPARTLADAILRLLVKDVEERVRVALAEAVARSEGLPADVASSLANDVIDVAGPILEHSPVLGDEELALIVRTHTMQYALAVAGRERISAPLGTVLAQSGESAVVHRLVGNAGAELSARTLMQILDDYRGDREVHTRLIQRPALPDELVDRLIGQIDERLEWALVGERGFEPKAAREMIRAVRAQADLSRKERDRRCRSAEAAVRESLLRGGLGPEEILAHLRDGEVAFVEAAFAQLARTDLTRVRQLLYGMDRRGLAALCLRAGFSMPHYVVLRLTLDLAERTAGSPAGGAAPGLEATRFVRQQYEKMKADKELVEPWFE